LDDAMIEKDNERQKPLRNDPSMELREKLWGDNVEREFAGGSMGFT